MAMIKPVHQPDRVSGQSPAALGIAGPAWAMARVGWLAVAMLAATPPGGAEPASARRAISDWRACANGGMMLPGTDTCVRLGGAVRAEVATGSRTGGFGWPGLGRPPTRLGTSARVEADVRILTDAGPLRMFTSVRVRPTGPGLR